MWQNLLSFETTLENHKPMRTWILALSITLMAVSVSYAQDVPGEDAPETTDTTAVVAKKKGPWSILPIPAVAYLPETSLLFGPVIAVTYEPPNDTVTRPTTLSLYSIYTLNKQFYAIIGWNTWTKNNVYNFTGVVNYYDFPEFFYGIGNETPATNRELVASKRFEAIVTAGREIRKNLYGGLLYYNQTNWDIEPDSGGILYNNEVVGSQGGVSSGLGYLIRFDNRVQPLNPRASTYFEINHIFFNNAFGSDFNFSRFTYDFRKFWEIEGWTETPHILAVQTTGMFHTGEVPWRMTSAIGGKPLRGYYWGRYRDNQYWTAQVEYRMPVWWRLGVTGFVGVSQMAPTFRDFSTADLKPAVGIGLRFLALAGINLRADLTWGLGVTDVENPQNIYIDIGEAF